MTNTPAEKLNNLFNCGDATEAELQVAAFNYLTSLRDTESAEPLDPAESSEDIVSDILINLDRYTTAAANSEFELSKILKTARWFSILNSTTKYRSRKGLLEAYDSCNPQPTGTVLDTTDLLTEELLSEVSKSVGYCPEFKVMMERIALGCTNAAQIEEIADEFGVHYSTVYNRYREILLKSEGVIRSVI